MENKNPEIFNHWFAPFEAGQPLRELPRYRLAVNDELDEDERVQILARPEGTYVLVTSAVRDLPGVGDASNEQDLRAALAKGGIRLNGPDYLFFLNAEAKHMLEETRNPAHVRALTERDRAAFQEFEAGISEEDIEGAYVELDHWKVFGAFDGDKLVAAGSAYPFGVDSPLADIGVLTHPEFRGQGYARDVVHALARAVLVEEHEPQYRCQTDNTSSVVLASRSGFEQIGTWDVSVNAEDNDARADES